MKKRSLALIALLLVMVMTVGILSACKTPTQGGEETTETTGNTDETTVKDEDITTDSEITEEETTEGPKLEGKYADLIENAHALKNGVNAHFTDAARDHYRVINKHMVLDYPLTSAEDQLVTISNGKGGVYVADTMDVYVSMENGKTYYSSGSFSETTANLFRYGYYYHDVRLYGQDFASNPTVTEVKEISIRLFKSKNDMTRPNPQSGILKSTITNERDPYINTSLNAFSVSTDEANALQITMRVTATTNVDVFFVAGTHSNFSDDQCVSFNTKNDGEFHTYTVRLYHPTVKDFTGKISALRLDVNGVVDEEIQISSIKLVKVDDDNAPGILLDRNLHTYTDKLHQIIRLVATEDVTGIKEIGMITKISADTVDKLVVYDKNGIHDDLDGIDWASAEYVGFDIKNVGIFGYILASHESSGKLTVTLDGGNYLIKQVTLPEGGMLEAQNTIYVQKEAWAYKGTSTNIYGNDTDYFFGQRIYTDNSHDFTAFLKEADIERNPLTSENIIINTDKTASATFDGYDGLRGIYAFTVPRIIQFDAAYYREQNFHGAVSFSVTNDERDRNLYVLTYAFAPSLECSALLDGNDMMLPIPLEVSKNFGHEFEEPLFAWGDLSYSEVRFPMAIKSGESQEFTVLQLYMNWGKYPLKQISSIQFFAPYYHLSTGVSESNCIASYYVYGKDLQVLPDHRAMSAPLWVGDPQHTAGGDHHFLKYTDADGNTIYSDDIINRIEAAGPTYAEIDLTYYSDDGKIKATYTHMEMPQVDENRAYYTMKYEILEDVSFKDFSRDFSFYSVAGFGDYEYLGYLDVNNESKIVETNSNGTQYLLGDKFPYFDMFKIAEDKYGSHNDYVNVSFLIKNATFNISELTEIPAFIVTENNCRASLSLNIGKLTLRAGDTIEINAIIMPWGSHVTDYTSAAPDKNVRDVRENSLIDPFKATAIENAEIIESEFLPMIRTTNGKSATFTLSGGENNVTFRVYGFELLTAPKLYELIDGEWILVDVSSATTPDSRGNAHNYDGYCVHYDGDATFSYSFVTTLTGDRTRTFKVEASEEFTCWQPSESAE